VKGKWKLRRFCRIGPALTHPVAEKRKGISLPRPNPTDKPLHVGPRVISATTDRPSLFFSPTQQFPAITEFRKLAVAGDDQAAARPRRNGAEEEAAGFEAEAEAQGLLLLIRRPSGAAPADLLGERAPPPPAPPQLLHHCRASSSALRRSGGAQRVEGAEVPAAAWRVRQARARGLFLRANRAGPLRSIRAYPRADLQRSYGTELTVS
jgi:hypothetical protein